MKSPQPGSARGNPSQDDRRITDFVENTWDDRIVPTLHDYIRIPNQSPHFDPDWEGAGNMQRAAELLLD